MNVAVQLGAGATMPEYKSRGAAGFDIAINESGVIEPGKVRLLGTGLVFRMEGAVDHFLAIFARSSLHKKGLMLANSVGVLDKDYCGPDDELKLALYNFTDSPVCVESGDRLAQGIFLPYERGCFYSTTLTGQNRGGFGSTGQR